MAQNKQYKKTNKWINKKQERALHTKAIKKWLIKYICNFLERMQCSVWWHVSNDRLQDKRLMATDGIHKASRCLCLYKELRQQWKEVFRKFDTTTSCCMWADDSDGFSSSVILTLRCSTDNRGGDGIQSCLKICSISMSYYSCPRRNSYCAAIFLSSVRHLMKISVMFL